MNPLSAVCISQQGPVLAPVAGRAPNHVVSVRRCTRPRPRALPDRRLAEGFVEVAAVIAREAADLVEHIERRQGVRPTRAARRARLLATEALDAAREGRDDPLRAAAWALEAASVALAEAKRAAGVPGMPATAA